MTPVSYNACMAMIHLASSVHCQPEVRPSLLMLEHQGRAMIKVRALLECQDTRLSEALIIAILCLATVERVSGNLESFKHHFSALRALEQEKGHLKLSSGQKIGDLIALCSDTPRALRTGQSAFKRRPFQAIYLRRALPARAPLPLGFSLLLHQHPISQDTISVLTNACNLGLGEHCVVLTHSQRLFLAGRRHVSRSYYNLLDSVPILLVPDNSDILFEKMLVLALSVFAWCGFSTMRYPQYGMHNAIITQLSYRLVQFQPGTAIERKCVVWMWLMVIDTWRISNSDGTFLLQGHDMLWQFHRRFPEYRSWTDLQSLTRLFFWTGDMETYWSRRWEELSGEVLGEITVLSGPTTPPY